MRRAVLLLVLMVGFVVQATRVSAGENFQQIDRTLESAFQHARNYPVEFDSKVQRDGLEKELIEAIARLEQMLDNSTERQEILLRLGQANSFAYNLDIPGGREKTDKYFTELFKLDPNNAEGHLFYGQHLSGRGEFKSAIEHLQVAADAGFDIALNMIGMAYVQLGNNDEARTSFQKFQNIHPDDPQVKVLLDSLEPSGEYELKPKRE